MFHLKVSINMIARVLFLYIGPCTYPERRYDTYPSLCSSFFIPSALGFIRGDSKEVKIRLFPTLL
jgi:hypothetical protein